jgi:hypothetical protein
MFIDEWFEEDFYQKLPLNYRNTFYFGQIFWTHTYYPHENLQVWRPIFDGSEPTRTIATKFEPLPARADAFNHNTPLSSPKLETNEELIVLRAKRRPVILIRPEMQIPESVNKGFRGKVFRRRSLVAQIFSVADRLTGEAKFSPNFIDRVRRMEFPQLIFLPKKGEVIPVDSLLRLDECQSVFTPHLQPEQYALSENIQKILRQQLQCLFTDIYAGEYAELRDFLMTN